MFPVYLVVRLSTRTQTCRIKAGYKWFIKDQLNLLNWLAQLHASFITPIGYSCGQVSHCIKHCWHSRQIQRDISHNWAQRIPLQNDTFLSARKAVLLTTSLYLMGLENRFLGLWSKHDISGYRTPTEGNEVTLEGKSKYDIRDWNVRNMDVQGAWKNRKLPLNKRKNCQCWTIVSSVGGKGKCQWPNPTQYFMGSIRSMTV